MNVFDMFPSKYLRGVDLKGPTTVTITEIKPEEVYKPGVGKTTVYVLYCERARKGVILNRPLSQGIAEALGYPDTDTWPGKQVVFYGEPMVVAGVPRVAIRAREVSQAKQPAPAAPGAAHE